MHEISVALGIVEEIAERARVEGIQKITAVRLQVGVLTAIVPDALEFAWDLATEGTIASRSRLELERVPLTIECGTCGCERAARVGPIPLPICAVCDNSSATIVRGRELLITAMEVEYALPSSGNSRKGASQERHDRQRASGEVPA